MTAPDDEDGEAASMGGLVIMPVFGDAGPVVTESPYAGWPPYSKFVAYAATRERRNGVHASWSIVAFPAAID